MDCRAVFIFMSVLIAQTACKPTGRPAAALNETIQLIREKIGTSLHHLDAPGLLPNVSCHSLNTTELVGPEQQPLSAHQLSTFRCYILNMSTLTPELSHELQAMSQFIQDVEPLMRNQTTREGCSLPSFEQDIDGYVFIRCLLKLLEQRLSKATFWF